MKKINTIFLILSIFSIRLSATIFDTEFLEKEDSCTNPKLTDNLAETFIKIQKNVIIPEPKRDVKFLLYTRKYSNRSQTLYLNEKNSVESSNFNPKVPTRILIHGFQNTHRDCLSVIVRNAYLKKGDFNVIVVDWSIMAARICYLGAIYWLEDVADVINDFTKFLHRDFNVSFDDIYLIGHSLGAHVAGLAGRRLHPKQYNTIFGLDPAGPIFQNFKTEDVIKAGDAKYVETIHTDMNLLGLNGQLGNASIYPGYGKSQKRCTMSFFGIEFSLDYSCNHGSAYVYFARSLTEPKKVMAKRCNSFKNDILRKKCSCDKNIYSNCKTKVQIGGEPSTKKSGVFYADL